MGTGVVVGRVAKGTPEKRLTASRARSECTLPAPVALPVRTAAARDASASASECRAGTVEYNKGIAAQDGTRCERVFLARLRP